MGAFQSCTPQQGPCFKTNLVGKTETEMETTIVYWGYIGNGKENGNYYLGFRV